MPSVRIWTLESDNDAKAVKCLADNLARHLQLDPLTVRWAGKKAFRAINKKGSSKRIGLKSAVINYLKQDACVIIVIDNDGPMSSHQRRQEPNSLINQVNQIISDSSLDGKVHFAPAVQELESWLLIDCLGILCFFATQRPRYREYRRQQVSANQSFTRLVSNHQKGDTELIVEAESGGSGAKEYLKRFSEQILLELNPKMSAKNVKDNRYSENKSPAIAEHVAINQETLRRNKSLGYLGDLLEKLC